MTKNFQELELKYYVNDLNRLQERVISLGAECTQTRVQEINLRFDLPGYELSAAGKALRLRYDTEARLTFKGPSQSAEGVRLRQEIEFIADNYQAAREFLLALGYQVILVYEKFRTTYMFDNVQILLDELPYGNFIEIEGVAPVKIREVSQYLGLNWEARISESYTVLFDRLRDQLNLNFNNLVFESFQGLKITAQDLNVLPADE
jgi:adenylate cyclase class 2